MNDFVYVITRHNQSFKYVSTFLSFPQIIFSTTYNYVVTMFYEIFDTFSQAEQFRLSMNKSYIIDGERTLQSCHFEQFVQYDTCISITFHVNYDTHALSVTLIVHITDTVNFLITHQFGNLTDQFSLVNAIRNLRYNNFIVRLTCFTFRFRTKNDTTTTRFISIFYTLHSINICTCREIRCFHIMHQSFRLDFRVINISHAAIDNISKLRST